MKINLARSAGFCSGVKRALSVALDTARTHAHVCMLYDIVHNEKVVRQIQQSGIKKINRLSDGAGKTLIISAHGAPLRMYDRARKHGYRIVDATCPMVRQIHDIALKMEKRGYTVIVIGDKKHTEVHGILGQLKKKTYVIDNARSIPFGALRAVKKAAVVVQSTQNIETAEKIAGRLKGRIRNLVFINTICRPTRIKQSEIKSMPLVNNAVIIIGSRRSANTRRLYEIARSLNKRSYWVSSAGEIKKAWFKGVKNLGVTAGASTPESTIREVISHIRKINQNLVL